MRMRKWPFYFRWEALPARPGMSSILLENNCMDATFMFLLCLHTTRKWLHIHHEQASKMPAAASQWHYWFIQIEIPCYTYSGYMTETFILFIWFCSYTPQSIFLIIQIFFSSAPCYLMAHAHVVSVNLEAKLQCFFIICVHFEPSKLHCNHNYSGCWIAYVCQPFLFEKRKEKEIKS